MRNHADGRGRTLYEAVGAAGIVHMPPGPSTDGPGANRWGRADPAPNPCVWDGCELTTDPPANQTLTIVASALRETNHVAGEMSRGAL